MCSDNVVNYDVKVELYERVLVPTVLVRAETWGIMSQTKTIQMIRNETSISYDNRSHTKTQQTKTLIQGVSNKLERVEIGYISYPCLITYSNDEHLVHAPMTSRFLFHDVTLSFP